MRYEDMTNEFLDWYYRYVEQPALLTPWQSARVMEITWQAYKRGKTMERRKHGKVLDHCGNRTDSDTGR